VVEELQPNFCLQGDVPSNHLYTDMNECLTILLLTRFHTKKLCGRLSSSEVQFYMENGHFAFLSSLLWATYDVHLRLIGKLVENFLLVIIELFLLGVTAEVLRANIH